MPILLRCHKGIGPTVTGTALVAADNFSARYDLNRLEGTFSRPAHKLHGQSYLDNILAQGAAFAELTMVDRFEQGDPTVLIRTGDELRIEPDKGLVTILNRHA